MTALTLTDLLLWSDHTTSGWLRLAETHPELLDLPCSIRESHTVRDLLRHIVAVELRYAEQLSDLPETPPDTLPAEPATALFSTHTRARTLLEPLLARDAAFWDAPIDTTTRSAGTLRAPRRIVLAHALLHGIRHYAQLGTLTREHGIAPDWPMDLLFQAATPV